MNAPGATMSVCSWPVFWADSTWRFPEGRRLAPRPAGMVALRPTQALVPRSAAAPAPPPGRSGAAQPAQTAKLLGIMLSAPDRHPRSAARRARLADPGPQQHRLLAARRRGHHGHLGRRPEPADQPGPGNDTLRARTGGATGTNGRSDDIRHVPDHRTRPSDITSLPSLTFCHLCWCLSYAESRRLGRGGAG
jgi:hypothetical protein